MNPVRELRERAEVTQTALARAGGTSQPTIAAYEAGRKSPTVGTVQRLARAVGLHAAMEYYPPPTREEQRSLHLHRAIVNRLALDAEPVLAQARRCLAGMVVRAGASSQLLREWKVVLDRPLPALLATMIAQDPWARELRHVTPFAGILSAAERADVYRAFTEDAGRAS